MKGVIGVLLVALILYTGGCGSKQREIKIVVVGKAQTAYWDYVKLGAEAAGKDLDISVKLIVPSKEDPAWQLKKIEELIEDQVDGIALAATDPKTIAPIINKAMQSGIPCVALDNDIRKDQVSSRHVYIGTSGYSVGKKAAEEMIAILEKKGEVAIVSAPSENNEYVEGVRRGFGDVLGGYKDSISVVKPEKEGEEVQISDIEFLLESNPDLDGIFCASDSNGIVVAKAIQKANKTGQIKVICAGESPELMKFVQDNVIQIAVARNPYKMGYLGVLVLSNMARAGVDNTWLMLPETRIINTEIMLITPMNIAQYREQLESLGIKVKF